jgi:hypothetical protein
MILALVTLATFSVPWAPKRAWTGSPLDLGQRPRVTADALDALGRPEKIVLKPRNQERHEVLQPPLVVPQSAWVAEGVLDLLRE